MDMSRPANQVRSRTDMIQLGRMDLNAYTRWPLGMREDYELWNCQKEWQVHVQNSYLGRLEDPVNGKHLCILAPSEHGKTTSIAIPFVLWALSRDRNLRILIAGSKDDLAANVGFGIDRHFANKGHLMADFGLKAAWPWNANEKFVERDNDNLIHPSILCVGPESEIQGKRADILIITDIATFKNSRTIESRQKLLDWIDHTLMPRLEPWGFALVEGHHVHHEDLYTELEQREEEWKVIKYKAILEEPSETNDGKARILAPEQWTYSQLQKIRARRPAIFQLIYQNIPVETRGLVNRDILERGLDRSRPLLYSITDEIRMAYDRIVIGVDPAFSIKRYAAYSCCLIFGITKDQSWDLLGGWRSRMLPHQLRSKIVQTILAWRPHDAFVEANASQILLVQDVRGMLGSYAGVVHPVYTLGSNPEDTVEEAVSSCVNLIETGHATFPYHGPEAQELTEQLFTEIVNFPSGRFTDTMMAFQIALRGLRKIDQQGRKTIRFTGIARSVAAGRWQSRSFGLTGARTTWNPPL